MKPRRHAPTLFHLLCLQLGAAGLSGCTDATPNKAQDAGPSDSGMQPTDAATTPTRCLAPSGPENLPSDLEQTGCMHADHPTQFAPDVLPYEVNSPLWSDGADKQRGIHLPEAGKIRVKDCAKTPEQCRGAADSGKWEFPVGTVLLKSFGFDGKLVETRLFARMTSDAWIGYTYRWDEAQTRATLVPDDRVNVAFNTGKRSVDWTYPNRFDCMECHNKKGGSSLGPETAQLNRTLGGQNQIDALAAHGVFEDPPAKPYAAALVTPYKDQAGEPPASTPETRVRSYMHANCAFCHRPDSTFPSLDMRNDVAFKDTHLCGSTPLKGDVGVANAKNLAPGQPMQSTMWLRMAAKPNKGRMPQIGTVVVDELGLKLMGDWISSLSACP